jgi:glucose/arabinose dehydrogenase
MKIWFFMVLSLIILAACAAPAAPVARAPETAAAPQEAGPTSFPTAVPPTAAPPTETPLPTATLQAGETVEPTATATTTPTATAVPDEWLTPAAHAPDLEQPPYVESECSDRFPCGDDAAAWEARIQVPEGFTVSHVAYIPNPDHPDRAAQLTSLTFGPDGLLYVATAHGTIYRFDEEGNGEIVVEGLTTPTGLAFQPGTNKLFVSNRVLDRNVGGEAQVSVVEDGQVTTLFAGLPCCYVGMHGPNGIVFGPDGYGYVGIGGRADHGEILDGSNQPDEMQPLEAIILRFNPDGTEMEPYAFGFRNPYDLAWTADGELFATDNGRDGEVPDELHRVIPGAQHGYPYFDCPACFGIPEGVEIVEPFYNFVPHSVALGLASYQSNVFPGYYNSLFTTLWTAMPFAERVMRFTTDGGASTFATGFAAPIDVTVGPDGALYVADYATGVIMKISYVGQA